MLAAKAVQAAGAQVLRGEAYKPRTSPYAFPGLGEEGLVIMRQVADEVGMPFVAEVLDIKDIETIARYADALRIGARNMQNFALLQAVGAQSLPVILKRGLSATYEEWLMAAEYIAASSNSKIILCERGIRTYETGTRNTPDLAAIPMIQQLSHLPIIFDPSHGVGVRSAVAPLALAAIAAGADGLMIDVHPDPAAALVDGAQAITPDEFGQIMRQVAAIRPIVGKHN
jgi:3-deoxy-7-phosphoheptulonate synthase